MANWKEIVKTGSSVIGSIIGLDQAAKAAREANNQLNQMQTNENTRYFNNMGDSLHRADVAELSKQVYNNIRSVNDQALNPVAQTTVEGANAIRSQNNQMAQQMASTVNADNTRLRMENENAHSNALNQVAQGRAQVAQNKAQQIVKATEGLVNSIQAENSENAKSNLFDSIFKK